MRSEDMRRGGLTLLTLGLLSAFGPLSTDLYLPGLPELTDFGASASTGQLTFAACVIGIGLGQLLTGPVSDAHGRRGPLFAGLVVFTAASVACALAPSILVLVALRFIQGCAGGAGIVIATAIVRDLYSGPAAARTFAALLVAAGVAPILSPVLGAQLLRFASWKGSFVFLGAIGVLLLALSSVRVRETLPGERRHSGGFGTALRTFQRLARDRSFAPHAISLSLLFGALFAYIAGSPFVLENVYGLSPQSFSLVFAINAAALIGAAQASGRLTHRVEPTVLLTAGLVAAAFFGLAIVVACAAHAQLAFVLAGLVGLQAANGLVIPNATAVALGGQADVAGSAAALLGVGQFWTGALVAPLVGLAGAGSALPMGLLIAVFAAAALAVHLLFGLRPVAVLTAI